MKTLVFTGGHHNSSLEVAKELMLSGWHIVWFGHKYSMWGDKNVSGEYKDVTSANIRFVELHAGKFYRTYNPLKLIRIPIGFFQAFFLILRLKIDSNLLGVFSSGGYLAVPTVVSAWILGIPSITHEQTVVSGWANKFISKFVKYTCVSWPTKSLSPKVVYTGLPVRKKLFSSKIVPKPKTIYITCGKQGSHTINKVIFTCLPQLLKTYSVIHQTGSSSVYKDYEIASQIKDPNYSYFTYDSDLAISSLLKSEIVIARSGAHTVYELGLLQKKSILVPIPWVSHHEQHENAQILVSNRQAILIEERDLSTDSLLEAVASVSALQPGKLSLPTDATDKLVKLVNETFK